MKKFLIFCLYSWVSVALAQNELTLPHLQNVIQSSYINPSILPEYKISVGLPGISSLYAGITHTGFTFNEVTTSKGNGTYSIREWDEVLAKLKRQNYLFAGSSVDLLSVGYKHRKYYFSFNITEKVTARFSYPKDLMVLALHGNESFIGDEVNLNSLRLDVTHRREFGLSAARTFDRFVVGVRAKFIHGLANASLDSKNLSLKTDASTYALTVSTDASLNTAGFPVDANADYEARDYLRNKNNYGGGLDLGATYKISKKIIVSASVHNLGFIHWNSLAHNYNVKGGSSFSGANLGRPLLDQIRDQDDSFEEEGDKLVDSLKNSFQYSETSNAYNTFLIPQLFLSGKYFITPSTQAVASLVLEKYVAVRPSFTIGVQQQLGRVFNGLLTYSVQYGKFDNFGLGVVIKPPVIPLQLYFAADNIFNTYSIINDNIVAPLDDKSLNVRLGINLVFGYLYPQDKLQFPSKTK